KCADTIERRLKDDSGQLARARVTLESRAASPCFVCANTRRPAAAGDPAMIDYAEFQSAIGLNWYDIDPNLQFLMRRLLAPADFEWLEPELRKIGALCGGPVAARAEVTDKHSPELVKF